MGLDIYISKKFYVENWDHYGESENVSIDIKVKGRKIPLLSLDKVTHITTNFLYFRNNHDFLNWFKNYLNNETEFDVDILEDFSNELERCSNGEELKHGSFDRVDKEEIEKTLVLVKQELKIYNLIKKKSPYLSRDFLPTYEFISH